MIENPAPDSSPFISVIIPTYSRPIPLRHCLAALAAQDYPRDLFEVIVVDDGGEQPLNDLIANYANRLKLKLLSQQNAGPGAARNRGAEAARGQLLAFTDDDCRPAPGWLSAFAREHLNTPRDLLGGQVLNHDEDNAYASASQSILDAVYRYYERYPGPGRFFASNNLAIPAEDFARLGGFDEAFRPASEDRDFCDRWSGIGRKMRFVGTATVRHDPQLDLRRFARQHFNYGRGAFQYHHARRRRVSGQRVAILRQHVHFVMGVIRNMARQEGIERGRHGALMMLWQVANFAGYVTGATLSVLRGSRNCTQED